MWAEFHLQQEIKQIIFQLSSYINKNEYTVFPNFQCY